MLFDLGRCPKAWVEDVCASSGDGDAFDSCWKFDWEPDGKGL